MSRFFTADLHLGHRNIIDYLARPFADVDAMNVALVDRWNDTVRPDDEVIVLGDFRWAASPRRCRSPAG